MIGYFFLRSLRGFSFIFFLVSVIGSSAQDFFHIERQTNLNTINGTNGIAVADYDRDNDLDIFIVAKKGFDIDQPDTWNRLFRNENNGSFTDVTESAGFLNIPTYGDDEPMDWTLGGLNMGASWGDFDNDGFPDILLTSVYHTQLFKNLGNGTFDNITSSAGLPEISECYYTTALWWDYNGDGLLDLYLADWVGCTRSALYRNNGDETFTDVTNLVGLNDQEESLTNMSIAMDFNQDGRQDLYLSKDFKVENQLFINVNGTQFDEQGVPFGLNDNGDGMGVTVGDYNLDGHFDLYITNIRENALLENDGTNKFTDRAEEHGVFNTGWGWGTRFTDFDLDGDEDLFVVNGFRTDPARKFYFKNLYLEGDSTFLDLSEQVAVHESSVSLGMEVFDYDNDGDQDVLVSNSDRESFFYENKLIDGAPPENLHWLKVGLEGTTSNRDGLGSIVEIQVNDGWYKRYYHGATMFAQSLQPVHFGLSNQTAVQQLVIRWPSGQVDTYADISADQTLLAVEGNGYSVLDISPSIKVAGCIDPNSCNFDPEATFNDGSCTYLESKVITGPTISGPLNSAVYSYPFTEGSTYHWSVSGGRIEQGQGTSEVMVHWNFGAMGSVEVIETNECSSEPVSLIVQLEGTNLPENLSIARLWSEALLEAIRNDFARPTVHARNLFHTSIAMYDAWAIYNDEAQPYMVNIDRSNFFNELDAPSEEELKEALHQTMSYAAYKLLSYRFLKSPGEDITLESFDALMEMLGYNKNFTSQDYSGGNPAALGNYIAQQIINFGFTDGANELLAYGNSYYEPVNEPLAPEGAGNPTLTDPNRWQPLALETFIDQSGNPIEGTVTEFLSPEWGNVVPFALDNPTTFERSGNQYHVFVDPGEPPYLDTINQTSESDQYKWGNVLVAIWASHLDPNDGVIWDISPNSIGNVAFENLPTTFAAFPDFYDLENGGDIGEGYSINPVTQRPYETQMVPRGDYTRVLAEFWADGPDSETPPGHWFTLLNYVNDHPMLVKKMNGEGAILDDLEWDVKAYFMLGGAMHDAAIAAWSVKGWYDYIRPISAIRYMAERGQSTDQALDNYDPGGIPLIQGLIEVVEETDPLAANGQHVGKIKLYTWKGHNFIDDPAVDQAGVGWILAENWWPYQRPSFVTPPFAGYVSGHSTYSRAAAELLTLLTGDEYFPGGYGEFIARKNEFLVFEEGPSVDVKLQWATYRDASDQCSLSRIWGGIHPPADDIPGRIMGAKIGVDSYHKAQEYFYPSALLYSKGSTGSALYPNPVEQGGRISITGTMRNQDFSLFDIFGREVQYLEVEWLEEGVTNLSIGKLPPGLYFLKSNVQTWKVIVR